jgi:hypothetical protein
MTAFLRTYLVIYKLHKLVQTNWFNPKTSPRPAWTLLKNDFFLEKEIFRNQWQKEQNEIVSRKNSKNNLSNKTWIEAAKLLENIF